MNPFSASSKRLIFAERGRQSGRGAGATAGVKRGRRNAAPKPIDDITDLPEGLRVICPYPPAALNPNARAHWSKKSTVAKAYRHACWALAREAVLIAPAAGPIHLRLDFFPPDRAQRDDDNAEAAFKAGRDGIADALKVDDSRFVVRRHWHSEPRACVVVTILKRPPADASSMEMPDALS